MSGQWEVVGRKKERSSKLPIPKSKEPHTDKTIGNGLKIEEVFAVPKLQSQNVFGQNIETKKAQTAKLREAKKNLRKERLQELSKPKPPKSIESALNLIDAEEFHSIFDKTKTQYPDAPIVWLKELVYFLNHKLAVDVQDVLFSTKPQGFPLSTVPSNILAVIEKSTKDAGKSNTQLFFDICLSSMATDMGKGLPAVGYKVFLQYIALNEPQLVAESLSKHVVLRNSYQNRPNIGLSILWAVGHVGYSNFSCGLSVFKELFLPLLEMKSYSHFVLTYLLKLVTSYKDVTVTKDEFLVVLDTIYSTKKNLPVDIIQKLSAEISNIKQFLLSNTKEKYNNFIDTLLKRIVSHSNESYKHCICDIMVEVFCRDPTTLASWSKVYAKNMAASAILLDYIGNSWNSVSKKVNRTALASALTNMQSTNNQLDSKKRKDETLKACIAAIHKINEQMAAKKKSGFPLKTFIVFITLAIAGLVYCDINQHGSWNDSAIRRSLKEYGVCEYSHLALNKTLQGFYWVDDRIEENFPGYHKTVVEVSEPYVELMKNLGKIARNGVVSVSESVIEQYPHVIKSIEARIPGLIEHSQNAVNSVYTYSVTFYNRGVDYLKTEVFVGQLSPENVQKVVVGAINTTQQKAIECYHWIYEKVQTSIK